MKHRSTRRVNHKDSIALEYGDTPEGTTQAGKVCPSCSGGPTQEGSLSITRRGGLLLFNCHRATCAFKGAVNVGGRERDSKWDDGRKPDRTRVQTVGLDQSTSAFLSRNFYISGEDLKAAGVKCTSDGDGYLPGRVCYPIYDPASKERGASYRSYKAGVHPKAVIQLFHDDAISFSWYKWLRQSDTLVLVEDQVSAMRLAPFTHSASLMGTNLSEAKIAEVLAGKYKKVVLAFDNDATYEAIKMQLEHKNTIPGLIVGAMHKDLKNMDPKELREWMGRTLPELGTIGASKGLTILPKEEA